MNSVSHPALILYGSTREQEHPLILVVGREPNKAAPVEMQIGQYDFDGLIADDRESARRCNFWHMAYRLPGRMHDEASTDRTAAWLKDHARKRGCSLIIIADAIPQGQLNGVANKWLAREKMQGHLTDHAKGIFNLDLSVTKRIQLVLLSGLENKVFGPSAQSIKAEAQARGIPCYSIQFFSTINAHKFFREDVIAKAKPHLRNRYLETSLTKHCIDTERAIISEFLEVRVTQQMAH